MENQHLIIIVTLGLSLGDPAQPESLRIDIAEVGATVGNKIPVVGRACNRLVVGRAYPFGSRAAIINQRDTYIQDVSFSIYRDISGGTIRLARLGLLQFHLELVAGHEEP